MATVALYPALTCEADARDVVARLVWHVAPFAPALEAISIVATLGPLQLAALAPPAAMAAAADPAALAGPLGETLTVYPARGMDEAAWTRLLAACDILYIWRTPHAGTGPFADLPALEAAVPAGTRIVFADPWVTPGDTARLAEVGLALAPPAAGEGAARLRALAARLAPTAHLVGAGPSLAQLVHFDLGARDVVASGALAAEPERFAALAPRFVCAGDSALHVAPSAAAPPTISEISWVIAA